jgi:nicotinamidase-related amidase
MKDPYAPEIKPIVARAVSINPQKSALLVLEMSQLCADPDYPASVLVPGITKLLQRARAAGMLIVFTVPPTFRGKPHGIVYTGFARRPSEFFFIPDEFDKFANGQLQKLLGLYDLRTLIITGYRSNMAVLYTATSAVQIYGYEVVIPVDGITATTEYEKEYGLYHFRTFPGGYPERFAFTTIDMLNFEPPESKPG